MANFCKNIIQNRVKYLIKVGLICLVVIWCILCIYFPWVPLFVIFLLLPLTMYILNSIPKFYKFLTKTSPFFWGMLYLLLIPFFAFIYDTFFPYSFSYSVRSDEKEEWKSNIEYELETSLHKDFARSIMRISLDDSLRVPNKNRLSYNKGRYYIFVPQNYKNKENEYYEFNPVNFREIKIYNDTISMNLNLLVKESKSKYGYDVTLQMQSVISEINISKSLSFNLVDISYPDSSSRFFKIRLRLSKQSLAETKSKYENIIIPFGKVIYEKSFSDLILSDKSIQLLSIIQEVNQGKMKEVGSNYYRMFYFSAITITTTGFGDIVPITEGARLTVAFETILGVILIGLFLNSLSFKIGEVKKDSLEKIE
jgi:Ion channel